MGSKTLGKKLYSTFKTDSVVSDESLIITDNETKRAVVDDTLLTPKTGDEVNEPFNIKKIISIKGAKDGYYIHITKDFLENPQYIMFAYDHQIKSNLGNLTKAHSKGKTL